MVGTVRKIQSRLHGYLEARHRADRRGEVSGMRANGRDELWRLGAAALADGYRHGDFTPVDVLDQCMARIEADNATLNAIVTLDSPGAGHAARESAQRWANGQALGTLDGIPLTVKDNIAVRGMRTTWGSRLYADYVPAIDELPIARLRACGAVILGKTNVPEFTMQGYTDNLLFGPTRNPWNPDLTPGGSSGGAVASVAAGFCPISIGTDGGGSIRRPASHTGLVGFKPSRGRVPRCDGLPPIFLDYESIGPMTRSVGDAILAVAAMSAPHLHDPSSEAFRTLPFTVPDPAPACRILFAPDFSGSPVDTEIASSVADAAEGLRKLGHRVEERAGFRLADKVNASWPKVSQAGLAWLLESRPGQDGLLTPAMAASADAGRKMPATGFFDLLIAVDELRRELGELFSNYDLLLTPSAAALPWPATEQYPPQINGRTVGPRGHAVFTGFANAAGLPAISLPCAPSSSGLPIGMQLVGQFAQDDLVCAVARQFERAYPWSGRWPALPVSKRG
jgi:aspartyl-tRNA(Asn)/glutamyl-tRNA(Gln) amidotransferase subunit A